MPHRRKRVVLITKPPHIYHCDGLVYIDFGIENGSMLAYLPSVLLATHAHCEAAIRDWQKGGAEIIPCFGEVAG